jgi:hypothetical protein
LVAGAHRRLRKVAIAELDPDVKKKGVSALSKLLMSQDPDPEGLIFLQQVAAKYHAKVPEAKQALDCMLNIRVLLSAGKQTAQLEAY